MSSSSRKKRPSRRQYERLTDTEGSNETSTGVLFPPEVSDAGEQANTEIPQTETTRLLPQPAASTSLPRKLKLFEIYRYADKWDVLIMITGLIAAVGSGATFPVVFIIYQRIVNAFVALGRNETNYTQTDNTFHSYDPLVIQVNNGRDVSPYDEINSLIIWYPVLGAFCFVFYWISYTCWIIASERQVRRMRYLLFSNIMRQDIGWFDSQTSSHLSTGLLIESLDSIRDGIGFKVADFTALVARIVGSLAYALCAGWKLTLVFLSVSPLVIITFNASVLVMKKYTMREAAAYNRANAVVHEVLLAIRTVTAFGGQRRELERYKNSLVESKRMGLKKGLLLGISQAFVNFALYGSIALIFWYGPHLARVEYWNYNAGIVIIIFTSCLVSTNNISMLIPPLFEFAQASAAGARVFAIIDRKSPIDIEDRVDHDPNRRLHGQIELRNVVFNYPSRKESQPILQGLSLKFAPGTTTAIVGETGCGKSTIAQLIQRFYDPEQGQVLFDGVDARRLDLKWLRSHIGIVSQEPILFTGTIEDNIRLGNLYATDDDIRNAARLANIDRFIERLPLKYKTPITGRDFSGGEKQRVAIARALVSNPKILLLDEATSALDTRGEREVQEALETARHGRTTIVIAHRLSTIRMADLIIGLERGGIIHEQGTHDELMARGGNYARAVAAQKLTNEESNEEEQDKDDNDELQKDNRSAFEHSMLISLQQSTASVTSSTAPLLIDNDEDDLNVAKTPIFLRVLALNSREWFSILLGSVASLIYGAVMPSFAFIFSRIFGVFSEPDAAVAERNSRIYSIIVACIGLAGGLCQLVSSVAFAHSGEALTVRMRVRSFSTILRQHMSWFELENNRHSILTTRLASDAAALKGMTGVTIGAFLNAIGTLALGLYISFSAGWKFTLVLLCFTPLIIITGMVQGSTLAKAGQKRRVATNAEIGNKYATEALQYIRTVVALHIEDFFISHYKEAYDAEFRRSIKQGQRIVFANALANSLMFFIHTTAFAYGARLVYNGEMHYVDVFQVFAVVTYATVAFGRSISMVPNYNRATQAAERIIALTEQQSRIDPEATEGLKLETVRGKLEFRHVSHGYVARPKIRTLRNLSFICPANSQTAIVGPSGSGKSTCIALIQRFYDPVLGSVYLDGHDLRILNVQWLRSIIGIVQQEPVLFNISIRDNIAYGDNSRTITDLEVENAAKKANAHDMIVRLAQGYNTMCGSEGQVQLSGGQKQRIAIARMLIREPKIVLFDEATSALDVETEKMILGTMEQARQGRTCVTIAHRLSTIRHSEKIAVLVRGHLYEQGTHEELMARGENGVYYTLIKTSDSR